MSTCRRPAHCECDKCYESLFGGEDRFLTKVSPKEPRRPRGLDKLSRAERARITAEYESRKKGWEDFIGPPQPPGKVFDPIDDPRRQKLITEHLPLARKIASRFAMNGGRDPVDCYPAAVQGLVEAARTYDLGSATPFGAYARKRLEGAVKDALASEIRERSAARDAREEAISRDGRTPKARDD